MGGHRLAEAACIAALDKSGRPTELITLKDEGHSYWSSDNEKLALTAVDKFLGQHIGPGFGAAKP